MWRFVTQWFGMLLILFCGISCTAAGCGSEGEMPLIEPSPDRADVPLPATEPLLVRLAREEPCNSSRIVLGEEFTCLAVYEVVNARESAAYVRDAKVWVHSQPAYSVAGIEWDHLHPAMMDLGTIESNGTVKLLFNGVGVEIEPHSSRTFRVWALIHPVATATDPTTAEPRSGDEPFADILGVTEFDQRPARIEEEIAGPLHVIRKSRLTVTIAEIPTRNFHNGRQELFEWTIKADPAGSIGVKQFAFHFELSGATVCDLRLHQNDTRGAAPDVDILAISSDRLSSRDLHENCLTKSNDIVVAFRGEYLLQPDATTSFILTANALVIEPSAKMSVRFLRTRKVVTDGIGCGDQGFIRFVSDATMLPGIFWSDRSSVPHVWTPCASSHDWTGDALIADLDRPQVFDASL